MRACYQDYTRMFRGRVYPWVSLILVGLTACGDPSKPVAGPSEHMAEQSIPSKNESAFQPNWEVLPEQSHIWFQFTQDGKTQKGVFETFKAYIRFDEAKLADAKVKVLIDLASVNTHDTDRDGTLVGPQWFEVQSHPKAIYEADTFTALDNGRFHVDGHLTLHGALQPVGFDFSLTPTTDLTIMRAQFTLNRKDFALGQGLWSSDEQIGFLVPLNIEVTARAIHSKR